MKTTIVKGAVIVTTVAVLLQLLPDYFPGRDYWPALLTIGLMTLLGSGALWHRDRYGSAGVIKRWSARSRRNSGCASRWAMYRVSSRAAMRRKARNLRPSFNALSRWELFRTPATEYATVLARSGLSRIWSPCEDVTMRIGGPRTGKTGELCDRILDAPGAVIATSTRQDLIWVTGPLRAQRGPVYVFNPSGIGRLVTTIAFDPLAGCEDPRTAIDRASDLLAGVSSSTGHDDKRDFWTGQAKRALAILMHAAALGHQNMHVVAGWIAEPDEAALKVRAFLRRSPEPAWESDAVQFLTTNDTTRSSTCTTITPALAWLVDSTATTAAMGAETLDVEKLLRDKGTVYMLGAEDGVTTPLVTALTGHIAREARRVAEEQGGRLDPPLTLALDEAALICPIPLDRWTADMGGRGVTIHIAAQSRAQLRQRWGANGAAAMVNNTATVLIFGGTRDTEDLLAYSTLTGEREEPARDPQGKVLPGATRKVPVMTPAQIGNLPNQTVLVIRRGMAPAVGKVRMAWTRRDVKRAQGTWKPEIHQPTQPLTTADIPAPAPATEVIT